MNVYLPNLRLPSAYQEVEYIQSTGTQYITTSIIPSNTKGIYIKLSSQDVTTDLIYIGSRNGTDTRFRIGNAGNYEGDSIYFGWNTINYYKYISSNTIYEAKMNYLNSRKEECNGTTVLSDIGTLSSSSTYPIYIFAGNDKGSTLLPSKIKLYSCKISDGSNVVNDFVPCYRKSDNVIGLYDIVNNKFYTNSGTGTFSKGSDVTMTELKNAYIGEYVEQTFTLTGVPDGDVNKYISIAKSGYKVIKVIFTYTNTITSSGQNNFVRISGSNNTENRYGVGFTFDSGDPFLEISGHINNQSDTYFLKTTRNNGTNNIQFTIERESKTLVCSGANTINQTYSMTDAEKNIVATIMNSATINAYSSRDNGGTVSDIIITVTYEPN